MNHIKGTLFAALAAFTLTGCTSGSADAIKQMHAAMLQQQRVYKPVTLTGPITIGEGASIKTEAPLEPLRLIPQNQSVGEKLVGTAGQVLKFAAGAYLGSEVAKELGSTPKTVSPEVVSPEVIFAPAP